MPDPEAFIAICRGCEKVTAAAMNGSDEQDYIRGAIVEWALRGDLVRPSTIASAHLIGWAEEGHRQAEAERAAAELMESLPW